MFNSEHDLYRKRTVKLELFFYIDMRKTLFTQWVFIVSVLLITDFMIFFRNKNFLWFFGACKYCEAMLFNCAFFQKIWYNPSALFSLSHFRTQSVSKANTLVLQTIINRCFSIKKILALLFVYILHGEKIL